MSVHLKDHLIQNPPKNGKFYIIAIDGRGGSGKTTLLKYIATLLPDFITLNGDDYFEPTPGAVAWGAFNDERFITDVIAPLKLRHNTITYRPYDWHTKPHITEKNLTITTGICIERSFIFGFNLDFDLKIWIETSSDISLKRGLDRDKMLRERAVKAWGEVWQPKEDAHIAAQDPLKTADIVIDGTKPFETQIA